MKKVTRAEEQKIEGYKITWNYPVFDEGYEVKYTTSKRFEFRSLPIATLAKWGLKFFARVQNFMNDRKLYSVWFTALWTPLDLDYSQIDDVEVGGIDHGDYPDFCDAYIERASYFGREMTESELDALNEDRDYVYAAVERRIY